MTGPVRGESIDGSVAPAPREPITACAASIKLPSRPPTPSYARDGLKKHVAHK